MKITFFFTLFAFLLIKKCSSAEIVLPKGLFIVNGNERIPEILINNEARQEKYFTNFSRTNEIFPAFRNMSSFTLALNQLEQITEELKREYADKGGEKMRKNFLVTISEQMIFLELIIMANIGIIKDLKENFKSDATKDKESIEDYLKPHLELGEKFLELYSTSLEYPLVRAELGTIKERIALSKTVNGSPLTSGVDQEKFTRIYRFLVWVSERASWRVPFVSEREIMAPEKINITQQLYFVSKIQGFLTSYESKNKTSHQYLTQLQERNLSHLTPAYEHQLNNLALILTNLNQKLLNPDQYFSVNFMQLIIEQDYHLTNEFEAEKAIIEEVATAQVHEPRDYQEIQGKVNLLVRLNEAFAVEHFEGFPEYSEIKREIDYLKASLSNLSQNATQIELNRMSQILDRFQRSTQRLTERATWREKIKFHFKKD